MAKRFWSFLRGRRDCVFQRGCVSLALASFFASYHRIISHSITSYIISHQWHDLRRMLYKNEKVPRHKISWEALMFLRKKRSIVYEALMFLRSLDVLYEVWIFSRSINILLYEAWKEGKVFFRRRLKNGMYIKFHASQRTELQTIHILHSNL